jgi:hypothetical protein
MKHGAWGACVVCAIIASCRQSPIPVAGDTVTIRLDEPEPSDSALLQFEDSFEAMVRHSRLGYRGVMLEGPTLVAVYPEVRKTAEKADRELARFVADFRADLPAARRIAGAAALVYEERYGPAVRLADPFNNMPTLASVVGDDGVGFIVVVPGFPPRTLPGHRPDTVLAKVVAEYLAEVRAAQSPPEVGT